MTGNSKQLELFRNEIEQSWQNRHELGRLYYDIYNLKYFIYDQKENGKIRPLIKKDIKVNEKKITLKLRPQVVADDNEVKVRYLNETDQNILDFIIYKMSREDFITIENKPSIMLSLNEIREKLKVDSKRIKESLMLLSSYKVEFENDEYEGIIPSQLLESIVIQRGRAKKTLIRLSKGLMNYIYENKYLLMNYEQLFTFKNRLSKILYKRICISNYMNFGETDKQKFKLKESICELLEKYGISYKNRLQKHRLFEDIEQALEELKDNHIIDLYELTPIIKKDFIKQTYREVVADYSLSLYLSKKFSNRFSADQKNKQRIEKELADKHIERMKKALLKKV